MEKNSKKQVKDFIIKYAVESVLKSSHCVVKHGRKIEDFVEYAKWAPWKRREVDNEIDLRGMIVDYFESDREHYFEIVRKMNALKDEICNGTETLSRRGA